MKAKIIFGKYLSRALLALLYSADIMGIYYLTGDVTYTLVGAICIPLILMAQVGVSLLILKAHSLSNSPRSDANYLRSCMDEVMNRSVMAGRKRRKIRLFVADNESLNCYTVGQSIVVNKSMLRLGDRTMLEASLAHQLSKVYNLDSEFSSLLKLNIFAGMCILGLSLFGAAVAVVLLLALIFGLIFSSWVGFTVGTIFGKVMKWCFDLMMRVYYYISKAFSSFLCRCQEFEADRFVSQLNYSRAMVNLFQLEERMEHHAIQKSWIEDLLDDSPSHYRRTVQLERMEEAIARHQQEHGNQIVVPYDNPLS